MFARRRLWTLLCFWSDSATSSTLFVLLSLTTVEEVAKPQHWWTSIMTYKIKAIKNPVWKIVRDLRAMSSKLRMIPITKPALVAVLRLVTSGTQCLFKAAWSFWFYMIVHCRLVRLYLFSVPQTFFFNFMSKGRTVPTSMPALALRSYRPLPQIAKPVVARVLFIRMHSHKPQLPLDKTLKTTS